MSDPKGRIVYASGRAHCAANLWHVVVDDGTHLRDRWHTSRSEEYWRARIITGMTGQRDPLTHRAEYLRANYGRRRRMSPVDYFTIFDRFSRDIAEAKLRNDLDRAHELRMEMRIFRMSAHSSYGVHGRTPFEMPIPYD